MTLSYINPPRSFEYLLWWYLPQFADPLKNTVEKRIITIMEREGIPREERKTRIVCSVMDPDKKSIYKGKNHNGVWNVFDMLGQNEEVRIENLAFEKYLTWDKGRFFTGQNFDHFPELAMIFKTIDGLDADAVAENDREATAVALEKGYIRKENNRLFPNVPIAPGSTKELVDLYKYGRDMIINDKTIKRSDSADQFMEATEKHAEKIASAMWEFAVKYLPKHIHGQIDLFVGAFINMEYYLIEEGIKDGILYELPKTGCTEGIFASVHYPKLRCII
jgi:hypothetical protein